MLQILDEMLEELPKTISRLKHRLPMNFPVHTAEQIFDNSLKTIGKLAL